MRRNRTLPTALSEILSKTEIEIVLNYDLNINSEIEYSHEHFEIELGTKYPPVKNRLKDAATDMRYFARSKCSRSLVYKKKFSSI